MNDDVSRAGRYSRFRQVPPRARSGTRRLFLHLRDLVYLHPEAASASAVSVVRALEARVIAAKAARERVRRNARPGGWPTRYGGSTDLARNGGDGRRTDGAFIVSERAASSWRRRSRSSSSRSRTVASGWGKRGQAIAARRASRLGRDKFPVAGASAPRTNPRPSNTALET